MKTQHDYWKEDDARIWWEINHSKWRVWFAWRPVKVNGVWVWGKIVYRKPISKPYVTMDDWTRYEYGTILDVLREK